MHNMVRKNIPRSTFSDIPRLYQKQFTYYILVLWSGRCQRIFYYLIRDYQYTFRMDCDKCTFICRYSSCFVQARPLLITVQNTLIDSWREYCFTKPPYNHFNSESHENICKMLCNWTRTNSYIFLLLQVIWLIIVSDQQEPFTPVKWE